MKLKYTKEHCNLQKEENILLINEYSVFIKCLFMDDIHQLENTQKEMYIILQFL